MENVTPIHQEAYKKFVWGLAVGLRNAVVCFDSEQIIIGGGIAKSADLFLDDVREKFIELAYSQQKGISIECSKSGADASLVGAALYSFMGG